MDLSKTESSNKAFYESAQAVQHYESSTELQPPERTIIDLLTNQLKDFKMLDIGVGTGRTTLHFAPLVKEYIGVDYSESMINSCKQRQTEFSGNIQFKVCNAAEMSCFEDNTFDFILFSFNGIDYLDHNQRTKAFQEIHRLMKPDGYFCFSTHNLNNITLLPSPPKYLGRPLNHIRNYGKFIKHCYRNLKLRNLKSSDFTIINDGSYDSQLMTYYIKPEIQLAHLDKSGFTDTSMYSLFDGKIIDSLSFLDQIKDPWIYYLCRKK